MNTKIRWLVIAVLGTSLLAQERPYTVRRHIEYADRGDRKLAFDLYRPKKDGPLPVGVVIHGGGWMLGSRTLSEGPLFARWLANQGWAAACIDYRLAPKSLFPAQIEDCRRAVQFIRANAADLEVDPKLVFAAGASAGGHLAALLGTQEDGARPTATDPIERESTRPACTIAISAPMTLIDPDPRFPVTKTMLDPLGALLGIRDFTDPKQLQLFKQRGRDASPLYFVTPDDAPTFLVHGSADGLVPIGQAELMDRALEKAGVDHEFISLPKSGHAEFIGALDEGFHGQIPPWVTRMKTFIDRTLFEARIIRRSASRPAKPGPESRPGR